MHRRNYVTASSPNRGQDINTFITHQLDASHGQYTFIRLCLCADSEHVNQPIDSFNEITLATILLRALIPYPQLFGSHTCVSNTPSYSHMDHS